MNLFQTCFDLLLSFTCHHVTSSKCPPSKSTPSPSVVSKSFSITSVTSQISLLSTGPSSSSWSSSSVVSSRILGMLVSSCLSLRFLPSNHHFLAHFFEHETQHSDSVCPSLSLFSFFPHSLSLFCHFTRWSHELRCRLSTH